MSKAICFEPVTGAAGDMILASLFDLGVNPDDVARRIRSGGLHDFEIRFERRRSGHGIMCGFVTVETEEHAHHHGKNDDNAACGHDHGDEHHHHHDHDHADSHGHQHTHAHTHGAEHSHHHEAQADDHHHGQSGTEHSHHSHHHRGLNDILEIIHRSEASDKAKEWAERIFRHLGQAEAAVHGVGIDDIHFHEVGAVDSIVDIFGIAIALDLLDISHVYCTGFKTGHGTVTCQHGVMPVPAPATAKLLEGQAVTRLPIDSELTTPTGAAVLTALAEGSGDNVPFTLVKTGNGHGQHQFDQRPNMIRAHLLEGSPAAPFEQGTVSVLQCEVDDQSGEVTGALMDALFEAGALDVNLTPVQMKKNRPGTRLTVLTTPGDEPRIGNLILTHSSSIGVRQWPASRLMLRRRQQSVETPWGNVRCKEIQRPDGVELTPEFESARDIAIGAGIPVRHVMDAARRWTPTKPN